MYVEDAIGLVAFVGRSREKIWWRNLRGGAHVRVRLRGTELTGTGSAASGSTELQERYAARFPRSAKVLAAAPAPIFVRINELKPF
jgi:hypothetical protein